MISAPLAVIPVLAAPLQVFLVMLPGILAAVGGAVLSLAKPAMMKQMLWLLWRLKFSLVAAAAVIIGAVYLVGLVFPGARAVGQAEIAGQDWTMFRGGCERRGWVPGSPDPVQGGVVWSFDSDARTFYSSPTVVGNRVYATSADKGVVRDRGAIYCLDADSGALVWKAEPDGYTATFSSPAVSGKYLVCGEGLHYTPDARVVCFDISRGPRLLWEYRTKSHVESSAAISGSRVYVGAGDDGYYCFELEPDAAGRARLVWHAPAEQYPDAESCPAVCDGKVFVGLGEEGCAVCCLEAETGKELWRLKTPLPVFAPPTVAGGRVFVGMGNGNFIETAEEILDAELRRLDARKASEAEKEAARQRLRPAGEVWGIDIRNPADRWVLKLPQTVLGAVVAARDRLFFASTDHYLYCVSLQGKELGRWDCHEPILASPACTDGHVYVVTAGGRLYAVDAETLEPAWQAAVGAKGRFISSPAVARGHVYVGSENDGLVCLGRPGRLRGEGTWSGFLGGPGRGGMTDSSALAEKGALLWRYPDKGKSSAANEALVVTAPAATVGSVVYVPVAAGARTGLACLNDAKKGRREKDQQLERWFHETPSGIRLSPAANEKLVLCVDGVEGDRGRCLRALAAEDGKELWKHDVAPDASGEFVLFDDCVCVQAKAGTLACLDLAGRPQWERPWGPLPGAPSVSGAILVAAAKSPAVLAAFDRKGGQELWRVKLAAAATTGPAIHKKTVLVGTAAGMEARSLVDGSRLWKSDSGGVEKAFAVRENTVAYVSAAAELAPAGLAAAELVLIDAETGAVLARVPDAVGALPPVLARGAVLFATTHGLATCPAGACRLEGAAVESWMDVAWLGRITSPMIADKSRVYFASEKYGFICAGEWNDR